MATPPDSPGTVFQFVQHQSFVSPTFWHKLSDIKLDLDRLSDAPKLIYGFYTNRNAKGCLLEVDYTSFNSNFKPPKFCQTAVGTIYNKNTIEDFKECDKSALIQSEGRKLLADFESDRVLEDPSCFARFLVLSFADIKCHCYYYWFAFPCPLTPTLTTQGAARKLQDIPEIQNFIKMITGIPVNGPQFFVLRTTDSTRYYTLKEIVHMDCPPEDCYFCFPDSSEYENPSWLMRTYVAFIYYRCPALVGRTIKFLGLRYDNQMQPGGSLIWNVQLMEKISLDDIAGLKFVGWERNQNNKMGPRMVSMRDSMDSAKLAENSVLLNLKLMKWRLVPDLNLDTIAKARCLLFGAGTLGCAVARNLLGWGFKQLTFIDNGKVGFSNPVRQSLYTHADAVAGNVMKAEIAATRLKEINPTAVTAGYVMQIPMPGHTIGESMKPQTEADLNKIENLVELHDIIFLLTDSRESRWLPTLLGAAKNKIVINAALGFDSYLVMRHGCGEDGGGDANKPVTSAKDGLKCISGGDLGCYFCNDVTAPGNSMKDRTLDQQCTVTRPGVSNIAASYAVELLVSLLQHPLRAQAPAYFSSTGSVADVKIPEGLLGIIPHSIRGMLCTFENILPATQKFTQCIACSQIIISEYRQHGNTFLFKAFETAKYLEDLTGISDFKELSNEIIDFDDSEVEMSDDE